MSFAGASERAAARVQAHLGDGVVGYQHGCGARVEVEWLSERTVDIPDPAGQYIERAHVVYLLREQLAGEPKAGDCIEHGAKRWYVQRIVSDDGVEIGLAVA